MSIKMMLSKAGLWTRQHSPALLTAGAIVTATVSVGMAIFSTLRLKKKIEPYKHKLEELYLDLKTNEHSNEEQKSLKNEIARVKVKRVLSVGALYLPSALSLGASITCMVSSHNIMKGRNLALAATCATLSNTLESYRARVRKKLGEEIEEKLYRDTKKESVEETNEKTGKTKISLKDSDHMESNEHPYEAMFGEFNCGWDTDARIVFDQLMAQQAALNVKLHRCGFVFLSDVYEALGFDVGMLGEDKARASHILGWVYDPENPDIDNYISFGLTEGTSMIPTKKVAAQIEKNDPHFWLSFNVDGDILNVKKDPNKKSYASFVRGLGARGV